MSYPELPKLLAQITSPSESNFEMKASESPLLVYDKPPIDKVSLKYPVIIEDPVLLSKGMTSQELSSRLPPKLLAVYYIYLSIKIL